MNIGLAIKKLRKERFPKLTQTEYAERVGITQGYLSQIEIGRQKPRLEVLEIIAQDSGIPLPVLFWSWIEAEDIEESKREAYERLKPSIDAIINSIFN